MPYYDTDNLQCWIRSCIEERYECLEDEDQPDYAKLVSSRSGLRQECQDIIEVTIDDTSVWKDKDAPVNPFIRALMNTIDFDDLLEDVKNDMENMIEDQKAWVADD